jgi:hypothetical protein
LNDGTIDRESAGGERRSTSSRYQTILDEGQELELFTQLAAVSLQVGATTQLRTVRGDEYPFNRAGKPVVSPETKCLRQSLT